VTLEEFGDFQCPPCGSFAAFGEELLKEYDSRVRIIFPAFPAQRSRARSGGLAGCGSRRAPRSFLGDARHALSRTSGWSKAPNVRELFESYAGTIGLNVDQFKKDMDGEQAKARVDSDFARAESLEIKVTPTLYINGQPWTQKDKTRKAFALRSMQCWRENRRHDRIAISHHSLHEWPLLPWPVWPMQLI
jgi:Predicted dithiol-disulfide isomerase involved in polyketide biosynthesis